MARIYTWYNTTQSNNAGPSDYRFFVDYSSTTNNSANSSTITAKIYVDMVNLTKGYGYIFQGTIWIDGSSKINELAFYPVTGNETVLIGTFEKTISHNPDGKRNYYIQGMGKRTTSTNYNYTNNVLVALPTIPRKATITEYSVASNGLTSLRVNWNANSFIDRVEYSLSGGAWTYVEKAMPFYINGLNPGTQYSMKIRVRRQDNQLWTESSKVYATTKDIAKITSAPDNVNPENPITVNFSNPGMGSLSLAIYTENHEYLIDYRSVSGTTITFSLTEQERNAIYNLIPTKDEIKLNFRLRTIYDSVSYFNLVLKKFVVTNANPTFSNFTFADINSQTVGLTGNNQKIIKGYSNLRATVSTTDKAIANKGATMKNYQLVVGGKQKIEPYNASANVNLDLNAIDNNVFTVYAIDSRGNSTDKIKSPVDFIEYFQPTRPNFSFKRENDTGTKTTLVLNGKWFNKTFGSVANTLTVKYYYKATNSQVWSTARTITVTKNGDDYSFNSEVQGDLDAEGFDSTKDFDIKFELTDKLGVYTFDGYLIESGEPDIALHKMGVAIKSPYNPALGGSLQIDGIPLIDLTYPVGAIYISVNNINPNALFGGTWVAWGTGRVPVGVDTSQTEFNTVEKIGGSKYLQKHRHNLNFRYGTDPASSNFETAYYGNVLTASAQGPRGNTPNSILETGDGNSGNLQPYVTCYMWKRTA